MNKALEVVGSNISGKSVVPYMVEVLLEGEDDGSTMFRRVRETLERIGIVSTKDKNTLIQTCHILHKAGRYYIAHYKMLYILDGKENRLNPQDIDRQSKIVKLLQDWEMFKVVDQSMISIENNTNLGDLKILKHDEKDTWTTEVKYKIGVHHKPVECVA